MLHDALALVVNRPEKSNIYGCFHKVCGFKQLLNINGEFVSKGDQQCIKLLNSGLINSGV